MDHEPVLIATIAVGLTAAFVGGLIARRLRLPVIVGYIVAGMLIGPFTPGLIADANVATELAEVGVILLMFGVGIEFSVRDLLAVRSIAVPGAAVQITVATLLGIGLGLLLGWGIGGGLVLGLAVSVASTVVLLRSLMDRGELDSQQGRIAVGWLIVEDLFTVVVLVLLPTIAPLIGGDPVDATSAALGPIGGLVLALGKALVFAILMIFAGARVVPRLLLVVARLGSRELFTLGVLAIALGIAYVSSVVFGVSFALGAFLAGLVVSESDMSHQAAADALPLRDAFAVLFFVSVGMLLDPMFLVTHPLEILAILSVIVVAQPSVAFVIVTLFGYAPRIALTVAAALGQIGEFSFILGTIGLSLGLIDTAGFQLIVAGALLSIALNPFLFRAIEPLERRLRTLPLLVRFARDRAAGRESLKAGERASLRQHAIICGYGRVGQLIGPALERRGFRYVVITQQRDEVDRLRARGVPAIYGDASVRDVLDVANIAEARLVIVATSEPNETRLIVERARAANPNVDFVARTHSDGEAVHLRALGKVQAIHGERELAVQMARYSLRRFGVSATEAEAIAQGLRGRAVQGGDGGGRRGGGGPLSGLRDWLTRRSAPTPESEGERPSGDLSATLGDGPAAEIRRT
ncbi:MAG TPA: cation:proton antiporter [Candidatus Limnocylindrales bacterium]|nr:cation:proton antiporter [Candidatus Limnocylindrales bacterium]